MRTLNYKTRFIDLASEINSQMPAFVVEKVSQALNEERKKLQAIALINIDLMLRVVEVRCGKGF